MSEVEKRPREEDEAAVSAAAAVPEEALESAEKKQKVDVAGATEPLNAEAANALAKLLAFYWSDANLRHDRFLQAEQAKDAEGFVALKVLLTFNKLKAITCDENHVAAALRSDAHGLSELVILSGDGARVRRAYPVASDGDSEARTVLVDGFGSAEPDIDAVLGLFEPFGAVLAVRKRRGGNVQREMPKRFLGSAFVEFKDVAGALAACAASAAGEAGITFAHGEGQVTLRAVPLAAWLVENRKARDEEMGRRRDKDAKRAKTEGGEAVAEAEEAAPVFDAGKILRLTGIPATCVNRFEIKDFFSAHGKVSPPQKKTRQSLEAPGETWHYLSGRNQHNIAVHS